MSKQLLLGDEAIAQAALDAGLSGVYAYPGTPSTEITEYIQMSPVTAEKGIHSRWCSNEKTAMEAALGMSFAGKRSLVCMKHVGMNVAADCFINSAITGVKGGTIVIAADDPSMHSSQNEQDSRFYGDFALIPMYEPSNQQEAYDMVYNGFAFSEQTGEPLLMRMVTRLAHSRSGVECKAKQPQNELSFSDDPRQFILLPGNARKRYKLLLQRQDEFIKASENSPYNKYVDGPNKKLGIIACGIGSQLPHGELSRRMRISGIKNRTIPASQKTTDATRGSLRRNTCTGRRSAVCRKTTERLPRHRHKSERTPGRDIVTRRRIEPGQRGTRHRKREQSGICSPLTRGDASAGIVRRLRTPRYVHCADRSATGGISQPQSVQRHRLLYLRSQRPLQRINSCVDMGASITMAKGASDAGCIPQWLSSATPPSPTPA